MVDVRPGPLTVLVVGATGSIGRLVAEDAVAAGHHVRALVRDRSSAGSVDAGAEVVVGDLTRADTLGAAVAGVDAVVLTHGSHGSARAAEAVDYGAVRAVLTALGPRRARIALMTAIGVTRRTEGHDWKRRGERLVRASGNDYTIVRPGWFDANGPDEQRVVLLQGDRRWAGDPSDGVISRRQVARVLVAALTAPGAVRRTVELVAERGSEQTDLDPVFTAARPDAPGSVDGVGDTDNLLPSDEPPTVAADLRTTAGARH